MSGGVTITGRETCLAPAALIALGLSACAVREPPLVGSTEHVDLHLDGDIPEGLLERLEHAATIYSSWFGTDGRVRVVVFDSQEETRAACRHPATGDGLSVTGCASGATAYQNVWLYPHEMVHAVASHSGRPPRALQEGVAEAVGCLWGGGIDEVAPDPALAEWLRSDDAFVGAEWPVVRQRYRVSASFVRSLLERHGRERVVELYRTFRGDPSTFEAVIGESLADAIAAWVALGPRPDGEICVPLVECSGPGVDVGVGPFDVVLREGWDRLGAPGWPGTGAFLGTLDVERASNAVTRVRGENVSVSATPCGGAGAPGGRLGVTVGSLDDHTWITRLHGGSYGVWVGSSASAAHAEVDLQLSAIDEAAACDVQAVVVEPGARIQLRPDHDPRFARDEHWYAVRATADTRVALRGFHGPDRAVERVDQCVAPCATECSPLLASDTDPSGVLLDLSTTETFLRVVPAPPIPVVVSISAE